MYGQKQIITPNSQPEKKKSPADWLDVLLHFASFFCVLFLVMFIFDDIYYGDTRVPYGFGISVVYLAFLGFTAIYLQTRQEKFRFKAVFPFVLCFLCAFSFAFHGYDVSLAIIPFMFYLSGLLCMAMTDTKGYGCESFTDIFVHIKAILIIPVAKLFVPIISVFKSVRFTKNKKHLGIIIGFVCGIPVFLIVASLLVEADAAFDGVMYNFVNTIGDFFENLFEKLFGEILDDWLLFVIIALIFSPYVTSTAFAFRHGIIKENLEKENDEENARKMQFLSVPVLTGFYGTVTLCYVVYLFSQLSYLFGAFSGKVTELVGGVSEYARRGFFEMSAVAAINLCLIAFGAMCLQRDKDGKLPKIYKIFSSFFCIFTMLLIITAMSKMGLYISEKGLTEKRIMVSCADIVLFVAFLSVLIRLFAKKFPYMKIIMCTFLIITTAYFAVSPGYVISSYNTNAYLSGKHKEIDISYITDNFFEEYYPMIYLDKVAQSDTKSADRAKGAVYGIYLSNISYLGKTYESFDSINEKRLKAYINENSARLKEYSDEYYKYFYYGETSEVYQDGVTETTVSIKSDTKILIDYIYFENDLTLNNDSEWYGDYNYEFIGYSDSGIKEEFILTGWIYETGGDVFTRVLVTDRSGEQFECKIEDDKIYSGVYTLTGDSENGLVLKSISE